MISYTRNIRILTQQDLIDSGCFDIASAISICKDALIAYAEGSVIFPDKVSVVFDAKTQNRINCLPAGLTTEKVYGMKWVSVFPENPRTRNLPNLSAVLLLSDMETGFPVAFMEGTMCSNLRTAGMSALAASYLAIPDPDTIGFIGCGEQAKTHFLSMKSVFPSLKHCKVASRTSRSEQQFIAHMQRFHPDVEFVPCNGDFQQSALDADIIITAISGQEKILQASWIKPGAFYCHVGGLEDDFAVAFKADKIVCDNWNAVKHRTQTISLMYQQGLLHDDDIYADLYEIVTGKLPGRTSDHEFTYYNGVGLSYVDVALANWMYKKAVSNNRGTVIELADQSMFDTF